MADFLSRWSKRKTGVREGRELPKEDVIPAQAKIQVPTSNPLDSSIRENDGPAPPTLTLEDVNALTSASDFSGFVAKGVDTVVKNAAMKKLFADPHYNIMDGLDIYIGDYSTHAPMSQSVIDEITKDGFLNMFQKEETLTDKAPFNEHPDLQLQRDDAAGRESAWDGAGSKDSQPAVPPPST